MHDDSKLMLKWIELGVSSEFVRRRKQVLLKQLRKELGAAQVSRFERDGDMKMSSAILPGTPLLAVAS